MAKERSRVKVCPEDGVEGEDSEKIAFLDIVGNTRLLKSDAVIYRAVQNLLDDVPHSVAVLLVSIKRGYFLGHWKL